MKPDRRQFIKQLIIGSTALSISSIPIWVQEKRNDEKLTILHTNDLHSRIEPFPISNSKYGGKGGFVRIHTLVNRIREKEKNILLFDSGDVFQGTPYFNYYKGELEFKLMHKIGYNAGTIGNHEFDLGIDNIATQLKHIHFPFLSANYDFSETTLDGKILKYKIFRKGKFKVGVFGLGIALRGLVDVKNYKKTRYLDPISVANDTAMLLKKQYDCNLVVCLSHLGYAYKNDRVSDRIVAQNSRNIDIILGGHTHTFLETADRILDLDNKEVVVNQVGWGGMALGKIDIYLHPDKTKMAINTMTLNTDSPIV